MACCRHVFQIQGHPARQEQFLNSGQWAPRLLASAICPDVGILPSPAQPRPSPRGWPAGSSETLFHLTLFPPNSEKSPRSVPYHYFEKGRLDECQMYRLHEQAPRSAHRFITEKAVFSRWAKKRPIVFAHPSWRAK